MRVIELGAVQLVRQPLGQLFEQGVFVMSNGDVLILGRIGDDLHEALDLGPVVEGHAEQLCR